LLTAVSLPGFELPARPTGVSATEADRPDQYRLPAALREYIIDRFGDENVPVSRAARQAKHDLANQPGRPFASGNRPVIRWIKGDGRDDEVTRSAIAQATRLFGDSVDYCLCTAEISPARARAVLAWAEQPVEWWPVKPEDNPRLSAALTVSGCYP